MTWTSTSNASYLTVTYTEHHIAENWEMKANVLCTREMPERHTGLNIAEKLQSNVSEFDIMTKIDTVIHDNARSMENAGSRCPESDDVGCFGNTLQFCVKPAIELCSVSKIVARGRKLVGTSNIL